MKQLLLLIALMTAGMAASAQGFVNNTTHPNTKIVPAIGKYYTSFNHPVDSIIVESSENASSKSILLRQVDFLSNYVEATIFDLKQIQAELKGSDTAYMVSPTPELKRWVEIRLTKLNTLAEKAKRAQAESEVLLEKSKSASDKDSKGWFVTCTVKYWERPGYNESIDKSVVYLISPTYQIVNPYNQFAYTEPSKE